MGINIKQIKNKTRESRFYDKLKEFPVAIREYLSNGKTQFDKPYFNRPTDNFLRFLTSTKYNIADRDFGENNLDIANIYLNILNSKETQALIDQYIFYRQWTYHPVRKFENWNKLASIYYNSEEYFWLLLLFNRITDPFTDLLNFNVVRIPNRSFLNDLPSDFPYSFEGGDFTLRI